MFKWNKTYIENNTLSAELLAENNIDLYKADEVYIKHPDWNDYYVSQYSNGVSVKTVNGKTVVKPLNNKLPGGKRKSDGSYYYYFKFVETHNGKTSESIGVHRAVADIFCPNFWSADKELFAHHIDKDITNNHYSNLVLLTRPLHTKIHTIKKMVLLKDGKIIEYKNILDLMYDTKLGIEEILMIDKGKKPIKSDSKYTVFNIKGNLIGFQYYPKKDKKKAK